MRVWAAALLAVAVTFALFHLMSALVSMDPAAAAPGVASTPVEFQRVRRESPVRTKRRRLPERPEAPRPRPLQGAPTARLAPLARPDLGPVDTGVALPALASLAAPGLGVALSDMDVVPLVRVPPEYPMRAARRGIGGWVLLEFTVTATGSVTDVVVLDSEPPRTFDRVARRAVSRFKYRPRVEDGRPVERRGVRIVIDFDPTAAGS